MLTIWFKGCFVDAILRGEKTDTIRRIGKRPPPRVNDVVAFSVGPRPAFAAAVVTHVSEIHRRELPDDRLAQLRAIYGDFDRLRRIRFRLVRDLPARRAG